ncbi:MAG: hypothetical protein WCT04_10915 [Planctomycetota bacterium]
MAKKGVVLDEKDLKKSAERITKAWEELRKHVLMGPLVQRAKLRIIGYEPQVAGMFATVQGNGEIFANPYNHPRTIPEWTFVLAHTLLHLAFGHTHQAGRGMVWNIACDCVVNEFLSRMRIGTQPEGMLRLPGGMPNNEEKLFTMWTQNGSPPRGDTTNGNAIDMFAVQGKANWADIFARAIRTAARRTLNAAGGDGEITQAQQARAWFVKNYPLLGSVLQHFTLDEDAKYCERRGIRIAAVSPAQRKIFINPGWALNDFELRHVLAHMALHAAFQHPQRRRHRDAFIWNLACDYCVNEWIDKMPPVARASKPPAEGHVRSVLFDGLAPEIIYERLMENPKAAHKLVTLAGQDVCDVLASESAVVSDFGAMKRPPRSDRLLLDALLRGYQIHTESGKGTLPFAMLDEMRALENPPLPWDVQLGRWFDEHIPPVERVRTYGRPSRRQSSTPDIARPRYVWPDDETMIKGSFGLVIDTSGSLEPGYASLALGAITTYALSRNIPSVRVVLSGLELVDLGPTPCAELFQSFQLSARGQSTIQPAIELLDKARDFPEDAPMLLLTAVPCDRVKTHRIHAYLIPEDGRLTYQSSAPVIEIITESEE